MAVLRLEPCAAGFPERLRPIPSPPRQLWVCGDAERLPGWSTPAVAVVGSRSASRDGLALAHDITTGLARAGIVIVSGLARGIDSVAHRATLDANGLTIAVLGSGLDRIYPPEHAELAAEVSGSGAVVTEYPPAMAPHAGTFPMRNRIISGLADAVVIVEAPERSGALITASAALEQGKDVMVVPGRVAGGRNRGGHLLIRDGARLVETADDILQEMTWAMPALGRALALDPDQAAQLVEFTVDDVTAQTGEPPPVVLARLLQLEISGQIRRVGFARFARSASRVLT
jgi:DNA processing protein